uniref:Uncharacterized protein n=1 Tax=Glossina palpalis gambiensis TaxID=67801 RepID=A0A1B0AL59_9MUSC
MKKEKKKREINLYKNERKCLSFKGIQILYVMKMYMILNLKTHASKHT